MRVKGFKVSLFDINTGYICVWGGLRFISVVHGQLVYLV